MQIYVTPGTTEGRTLASHLTEALFASKKTSEASSLYSRFRWAGVCYGWGYIAAPANTLQEPHRVGLYHTYLEQSLTRGVHTFHLMSISKDNASPSATRGRPHFHIVYGAVKNPGP